jgi:hypothetical protein
VLAGFRFNVEETVNNVLEGNERLEAALQYVRDGYSVIPVNNQTKRSLIKWKEFQTRLPTENEILQWWEQFPSASVAIVTGKLSNIIVLDADLRHGARPDAIFEKAPTSRIVQTGNGYHFWYQYPEGYEVIPPLTSVLESVSLGLDVRGDGSYVIVPPSMHKSGAQYLWYQEEEIGVLPDKFCKEILKNYHSSNTTEQDSKATPEAPNEEKWLSNIIAGVGEGERNQALTKYVGYLAGKGIPIDVATRIVEEWDSTKNIPPLRAEDPAQFQRTIESVYNMERAKTAAAKTNDSGLEFTMQDYNSYMMEYVSEEVSWLIDGWVPLATTGLIVSPPATYKTWLLADLAVSVATGTPFLGRFKPSITGPVFMFQQEDAHQIIASRLNLISTVRMPNLVPDVNWDEKRDDFTFRMPPKIPIYIHPERMLRFGDRYSIERLEYFVKTYRPVLVILDPLYSAAGTDDYMASAAGDMMIFKRLRDEYGTTFLVAHHTKKGADGGREGAWGSQFLNAWLETGWQIRKTEMPNVVTLMRHFKNTGTMDTVALQFDIDDATDWRYNVILDDEDREVAAVASPNSSHDIITNALSHGGMDISELVEVTGKNRTTVYRCINQMLKDAEIVKVDRKFFLQKLIATQMFD